MTKGIELEGSAVRKMESIVMGRGCGVFVREVVSWRKQAKCEAWSRYRHRGCRYVWMQWLA